MKCPNPIINNTKLGRYFVPCGKCYACINRKLNDIRLRTLYHYAKYNYCAYYVTYTYNNESLPSDNKLSIKNIQDYFKRLRINIKRSDERNIKLSYILSGEYGSPKYTQRPHYHAMIFGLPKEIGGKPAEYYIHQSWGNGFTKIEYIVNQPKVISYILKYILKDTILKRIYLEKNQKYDNETYFYLISKNFGKLDHKQKKLLTKNLFKEKIKEQTTKLLVEVNGHNYAIPRYWKLQLSKEQQYRYNQISRRYFDTLDEKNIYIEYNILKKKLLRKNI